MEIDGTGLDPKKQIMKLPMDFGGLAGLYFSDVDGYSIFNSTWIYVEEKAFWGNPEKEKGCIILNHKNVDDHKSPAIVFFTSSYRNHIAMGDTEIKLKNSKVIGYYTNYAPFKKIPDKLIIMEDLPLAIQQWIDCINQQGYWQPVQERQIKVLENTTTN